MPDKDSADSSWGKLELAYLRSHEIHLRHIYRLRWGGLVLSAMTIIIGAVMVFYGLEGSFDWAVETPNSIGAKLTNASPGIVFATVGMVLGFVVIRQKPVNYRIGGVDRQSGKVEPKQIDFGIARTDLSIENQVSKKPPPTGSITIE